MPGDEERGGDLLSDIVRTLQIVGSSYYRADLNRPFGIAMTARADHIRVYFVLRGALWMELPGGNEPVKVREGAALLLLSGIAHRLVDAPGGRAIPWDELVGSSASSAGRPALGAPSDVAVVFGELSHLDGLVHPVFASLPELVLASTETGPAFAAMRGALRLIDIESSSGQPGAPTIINRLSEVILIQILRNWLDQHPDAAGAVRAMQDPRIGRVLNTLHAKPAHDWSVAEMGSVAAMSRTAFATAFKSLIGVPPMQYLAQWRLTVARGLLLRDDLTLLDIAQRVGYRSQASFSQAFREVAGVPPGQYRERARRQARASDAQPSERPAVTRPPARPSTIQNIRRGTVSVF